MIRLSRILVAVAFAGLAQYAHAQQPRASESVDVIHLRGPIYMITAGGSNITASIGPDGVLLVDSGPANLSEKVLAAIREVQKQLAFAQSLVPPRTGGAETRSATQSVVYDTPK